MFHGLELMFHHLLGITGAIGKLSNLPFLLGVLTQLAPYLWHQPQPQALSQAGLPLALVVSSSFLLLHPECMLLLVLISAW
jgi:hypothetical protein